MAAPRITLEDLFNLSDSVIYSPDGFKPVSWITIDSRDVKKNSIFVAIKGENHDGHSFVKDVIKNGINAVVINEDRLAEFDFVNNTIVTVKDTGKAYGELANIWRKKLDAKVVSLTGSNGKTTTKDILHVLLSEKYKVHSTYSNNNNHIGVPLTILSARNCDVLILEHGTNHFGEIDYTAKIAEPDYAMITNIGNSHLEFLENKQGVYKEKKALFEVANNNKGILIVNNDDPVIKRRNKDAVNKLTYGFKDDVDVKGEILGYTKGSMPIVSVKYKNKSIEAKVPLYGIANAKNLLAACAVALKLGLTKKELLTGIEKLKAPKGRLAVTDYKGYAVIDDTYNANPESMKNALDVLQKYNKYERKIIVLGDMFELGDDAVKMHEELAKPLNKCKPGEVLLTGKLMKHLGKADITGKVKHFANRNKLSAALSKIEKENTVFLFKGSRGMKMEEFIEALTEGNDK